jgi:hypothetical protein
MEKIGACVALAGAEQGFNSIKRPKKILEILDYIKFLTNISGSG